MKRVEFDGGWLMLHDPAEVPTKARNRLRAAVSAAMPTLLEIGRVQSAESDAPTEPVSEADRAQQVLDRIAVYKTLRLSAEDYETILAMDLAAVVAVIADWSLSKPITVDTLEALPAGLYDKVDHAAAEAGAALLAQLRVDFSAAPPTEGPPTPTGA